MNLLQVSVDIEESEISSAVQTRRLLIMRFLFVLFYFLLLSVEAKAQYYEQNYRYFKTTGFKSILSFCSTGRILNRKGYSFWGQENLQIFEDALKSYKNKNEVISVIGRVMKETCPEIW